MDDLTSSCAIMTRVIVVIVSVGGVDFSVIQPYWNFCTWPSVLCFLVQNVYLLGMYVQKTYFRYCFVLFHSTINCTTFIYVRIEVNEQSQCRCLSQSNPSNW